MKGIERDCEHCPDRCPEPRPDNADAYQLFLAAGTQWLRAGMDGTPVGLNYPAVEILRVAHGLTGDRDLWDRLRVLEVTAVQTLNEARRG